MGVGSSPRERTALYSETVGSHWSSKAQVNVLAINWRLKHILLGEAKWTREAISRRVVRELVSKEQKR